MSTTPIPTRTRARTAVAITALAALVLAGCGSSGGSSGGSESGAKSETEETTTTVAKPAEATTTEPDEDDEQSVLPTEEADAPSGDWVSVRFNVAVEPEPAEFNAGSAEARLYDVEADCDGDGPCSLIFNGGGEGGSFAMPDTEPITGDPIVMEPDGVEWTGTTEEPSFGCTEELDGPYVDSTGTRSLRPVRGPDGEIIGLVGTLIFTDTVNAEGEAAGCPDDVNATYAYAVVVAPNDGIRDIDEYEVDGTFRQTIEVTESEGQVNPLYQDGGISTSLPDHDIEMSGSCGDGDCDVDLTQINGDGNERSVTLTSDNGRGLSGSFDEVSGCSDDETGEIVFEDGAYESTGTFEDLTPIWIEDGEVKAFIGLFSHEANPTDLGKTNPSCSTRQTLTGWTYLVSTDVLG